MQNFYHVDRLGKLQENQDIKLFQYKDIKPSELQAHVDEMFPAGFSHHGEGYFLRKESKANIASPNIEILFEYVRRSYYKSRPSRFQSVFAFETIATAMDFKQRFGDPNSPIWELESQESFKADMNFLTIENNSILEYSYYAHLYWQGRRSRNPLWEYLLVPPVRVIKRIKENNQNI